LPIASEDDVEIAIVIDVIRGTSGFHGEKLRFDDVPSPTLRAAAIPDQCRGYLPKTHNEVCPARRIDTNRKGAGLLRGGAWHG
jgi:hypothetical protein